MNVFQNLVYPPSLFYRMLQLVWKVLGIPTTKSPVRFATFISHALPPLLFYFVMALLAITPQTRALRMALWPVVALLALRAAFSVVIVVNDPEQTFHVDLAIPMLFIVTRSLYWALEKEPLVRRLRPVNSTPSTFMDVLDLVVSFRGYGWNWSRGLYVPRDTRPPDQTGFIYHVVLSTAVHAFICGTLYRILRSFSPLGLGSITGGSIFDGTLPFYTRYLRSSILTIVGCLASYSFLQTGYDVCTLGGVLFLGQDPAQWPPGFDAPWRATSLADFWGRRWHQWFRHIFLIQGGYPLSFVFGRTGLVIGAFLSSGVFHHIGLYSLNSKSELWQMLVGFGMMAPGILAERMFKRLTGRRVGGVAGWVWTMMWLVLWGNFIIDGFVGAGLFRSGIMVDVIPPWRTLVERIVMDFDAWLCVV